MSDDWTGGIDTTNPYTGENDDPGDVSGPRPIDTVNPYTGEDNDPGDVPAVRPIDETSPYGDGSDYSEELGY